MKNTEGAFHWIVSVLKKYDIPFQITGGLAAKVYGSKRPLNDIDIDIPDDRFEDITPDVNRYITYWSSRYKDERWDLLLMTLNYEGQKIDISGGSTMRICDSRTNEWCLYPTDFSRFEEREIFGLVVPVVCKEDLINYKRMLVGEHQKEDIDSIS